MSESFQRRLGKGKNLVKERTKRRFFLQTMFKNFAFQRPIKKAGPGDFSLSAGCES